MLLKIVSTLSKTWINQQVYSGKIQQTTIFGEVGLDRVNPFTASYEIYCQTLGLDVSSRTSKPMFGEFLRVAVVYADCFIPPDATHISRHEGQGCYPKIFRRKISTDKLTTVFGTEDSVTARGPSSGQGKFGQVIPVTVSFSSGKSVRRPVFSDKKIVMKVEPVAALSYDFYFMVREILMLRLLNFHGVLSVPLLRSSGMRTGERGEHIVEVCMTEVPEIKTKQVIQKRQNQVALATAKAVQLFHDMTPRTVHGDLHGDNILVSEKSVFVIDPAMAVFEEGDQPYFVIFGKSRSDCQPPEWVERSVYLNGKVASSVEHAEQLLQEYTNDKKYPKAFVDAMRKPTQKSDVFSMGIYFHELYSLSVSQDWPVEDCLQGPQSNLEFSLKVTQCLESGACNDPPIIKLIASMLQLDPSKRPTMGEVVSTLESFQQ